MKIILTGGAGFIGSCLLEKLNQEGISDILIVDELGDSGKERNLNGKGFKDCIEKDEFLKLVIDKKIGKDIDVLIHFGACTSTILDDEEYFMKNNYQYSKSLCSWALENEVHFLYASSAATYGDGQKGFSDSNEATLGLRPLNVYARSKHLFDLWLINNKLSSKVTGFKFFNVYGPNEYHKGEMRSVIAKSYGKIIRDGKIGLFKSYKKDYRDGEQKRDFIYVKDAVDIAYYFVENPEKHGIFNVGTGQARTWNELACAIFSALSMKPAIEYIDMPEGLRERYQYYTQADLTKLRNAGCGHEFFDFSAAIKDYVGFL
ncbi:MAG: ADP-glyceromanno-heptose 6-epimerase, partial [Candidatus Omnitrophota bacterium]|nr:ADP-glyceromanno-heptose 6-epimerase [Candidatus Omnitrophota bacterium]